MGRDVPESVNEPVYFFMVFQKLDLLTCVDSSFFCLLNTL